MKLVESFCKKAIEMGIEGVKIIDPDSIVTAEWVRMKCQYGCPGFGESLCCPPHTPTPDMTRKVIDSYQKAILLHQRLRKGEKRGEKANTFREAVVCLEIKMFLDGYYKAWSMVWDAVLVIFARNVTCQAHADTDLRRGLRWRDVALMSLRRQGIMGLPLKLCGHAIRNEISSG